jgi:tRNA threonylcarbamoyladenosine biosynthesis protein TsaB
MDVNTRILVIETSGRLGGVALARGPRLIVQREFTAQLKHAAQLMPTIDHLCGSQNWEPPDIQHLYVSTGPGSFTGLRIAVTLAKSLAFAQLTKIVPIPSLEALTWNAQMACECENLPIRNLALVLEAGRGRIFSAVLEYCSEQTPYESSSEVDIDIADRAKLLENMDDRFLPAFRIIQNHRMMTPAELVSHTERPLYLLGEGLKYHHTELEPDGKEIIWVDEKYWQPRAQWVHRCGWPRARAGLFAEPEQLSPIYLRRPEAVDKWEQLHGK